MEKILLPEHMGYKANLHSHSTDSDGYFTPEEMKKFYMEQGYSILAYTDHVYMRDRSSLNDENFVALNGYENYIFDHNGSGIEYDCYHLNFYSPKPDKVGMVGIAEYFYNYYYHKYRQKTPEEIAASPVLNGFCSPEHSIDVANDIIRQAQEQGYLVVYNHPKYNLHTEKDYVGLKGLLGVEVINYAGTVGGCIEDDCVYDRMLRAGQRLYCFANDDNHNNQQEGNRSYDSFGGFNVMYPKKLDYDSVFECMKTGDFYASGGAIIRGVSVIDDIVYVGAEDALYIQMTTNGRHFGMAMAKEKPVTSAVFKLVEGVKYFRITVMNTKGQMAYTRGYFLDEWQKK